MTTMPMRAAYLATRQPVTPATATALQFQWTQLPAHSEPADADVKFHQRLSVTPVDDEEEEEEEEEQQQPVEPKEPAWQSPTDLPDRRAMVQRILTLTEKRTRQSTAVAAAATEPAVAPPSRRRDRRAMATATTTTPAGEGATALAKRIELSLYSRAGSLEEYRNTATLRRRLQSLVSLSFHEAAATKDATTGRLVSPVVRAGSKRSRPAYSVPVNKRRRVLPPPSATAVTSSTSALLGPLSEDCLRAVFSFLHGRHVLQLRCLSRFAADLLPSAVHSLEIDVARLHLHFSVDAEYAMFRKMASLQRLVVFKTSNPCAVPTAPEQKLALHSWGCAELDVSHNNEGEAVMQHLANALDLGAGASLHSLQVVSTFSNTSQRNGLRALCLALARGACPRLHDLLLGGNSISDAGAADIARLLESRALPQLARLDLRRNYIGECGLRRLMLALAGTQQLQQLKYLCMGGNLITDNCVAALTSVLGQGTCPQLRFLGLEDNFLSPEGVQSIIQAAVSGGMVPKLHRVSSDGAILTTE